MSAEPRTVTLVTVDRGPVTIPEPAWCAGHSHHDPRTTYAEIIHSGPDIALTFRNATLLTASIVQSPHASRSEYRLGGRIEGASVFPLGETLDPMGLYDLAADLVSYAAGLRRLAVELNEIFLGGER
ncbi:hypothetical protein [Streptomyces sp. NPDC051214]|uniref:DUF6907 domain-containing protein n=1 Tax=Streptomyces sp. NPDC051214 TaxID=3155282 RepID=UPI003445318B